jgi:acyl CoA:acetate/3-ketoacid CoA transferase beta subunit
MIVTDLCVFTLQRGKKGLTLVELAPGVNVDEVAAKTKATFTLALQKA